MSVPMLQVQGVLLSEVAPHAQAVVLVEPGMFMLQLQGAGGVSEGGELHVQDWLLIAF